MVTSKFTGFILVKILFRMTESTRLHWFTTTKEVSDQIKNAPQGTFSLFTVCYSCFCSTNKVRKLNNKSTTNVSLSECGKSTGMVSIYPVFKADIRCRGDKGKSILCKQCMLGGLGVGGSYQFNTSPGVSAGSCQVCMRDPL